MNQAIVPVVLHVGYPKTGTTTLQKNVFPLHPDIEYLGKYIPSFQYCDNTLSVQMDALLHQGSLVPLDLSSLKVHVDLIRHSSNRKVILLSSESMIHPDANDLATVAKRLKEVFGPCHIWITIREQISALLSFYWMHGRHGQYLTIAGLYDNENLSFPLSFSKWIELQKRAPEKNFIGTLRYDKVVDLYRHVFGSDQVSVLMYETLLTDPDGYISQVSEILGVDCQTMMQLSRGQHENRSSAIAKPWAVQDATKALQNKKGFWGKFDLPWHRREDVSTLNNLIADLRGEYSAGNVRLSKQMALDLAAYNYAI